MYGVVRGLFSRPRTDFPRTLAVVSLAMGVELALSGTTHGQTAEEFRASAQELLRQGDALQRPGTAESLIKAREKFEQACQLFESAKDVADEGSCLNDIGGVYDRLGQKQQALGYFERALSLAQTANQREGQMTTLHNIGAMYDALGQKDKALDYYGKSQKIAEETHDRRVQALNFNNMGGLYASWGDTNLALESYQKAQALGDLLQDPAIVATSDFNIGEAYETLGNEQRAMNSFQDALQLTHEKNPALEAAAFTAIGQLYDDLGEKQKAMDYFQKALPLRVAAGDPSGLSLTLNSICKLHSAYGQHQTAETCWQGVLKVVTTANNPIAEAAVRGNLGLLYDRAGEKQKALDQYEKALVIARRVGNRAAEVTLLNNIGRVYDSQGNKEEALTHYEKALPLAHASGNTSAEAGLLVNRAAIERDRGDLSAAQTDLEHTVTLLESTRSRVAGQDLRTSYLATVHGMYELYVDVLMRAHARQPTAGNDGKALETSERGRALSLLEMLTEAHANIKQGVSSILLDRERALQRLLNAKSDRLTRVEGAPVSAEKADALKQEIARLQDDYQKVETEIRESSPRYASLTQPRPLNLKQIQQLLDPDTLLLEYSLGADQSYLWAVGSDWRLSYVLPGRQAIEALARDLYAKLTQRHPLSREEMQAATVPLSQTLLGPVAPQLGKKRLVIVADGALTYIPFGVLSSRVAGDSDQTPLIVDHEVVYLPSASTVSIIRRNNQERVPASKLLAVMADPVFSRTDERLKKADGTRLGIEALDQPQSLAAEIAMSQLRSSVQDSGADADGGFHRLQHSREEANGIAAFASSNELLESLDFSASKAAVMNGTLDRYRIVHFATHGLLDSERPELSGIVLSLVDREGSPVDGFLHLQDIFGLTLQADLAVLSACETGLGKNVRGEGLIGLTRGLMYSGVPRVIVSLWKVDDDSTAELMLRFYDAMLKQRRSPAAALQAAQVSMWKNPPNPRWSAPYFWATFTLQGEWK